MPAAAAAGGEKGAKKEREDSYSGSPALLPAGAARTGDMDKRAEGRGGGYAGQGEAGKIKGGAKKTPRGRAGS